MTSAAVALRRESASVRARRAARVLLAVAVGLALALASWSLLALSLGAPVLDFWGFRGDNGLLAVAFGITGYVIVTRRPRSPVGWCFLLIGVANGVDGAGLEYGSYVLAGPGRGLAGAAIGAWFHTWLWVWYIALTVAAILYFPDGRLSRPGWRAALVVAGVGAVVGGRHRRGP